MLFEETTWNPLVNRWTDVQNQCWDTFFAFHCCSVDWFKEECNEWFERVLVHVIHNAQRDNQEVKHRTFSSDDSIVLTLHVDFSFRDLRFLLLFCDFNRGFLCLVKILNELCVIEDGSRVCFGERLQQIWFEFIECDGILVLLFH